MQQARSTLGVFPVKPLLNGIFALGSGFFYQGTDTVATQTTTKKTKTMKDLLYQSIAIVLAASYVAYATRSIIRSVRQYRTLKHKLKQIQ